MIDYQARGVVEGDGLSPIRPELCALAKKYAPLVRQEAGRVAVIGDAGGIAQTCIYECPALRGLRVVASLVVFQRVLATIEGSHVVITFVSNRVYGGIVRD